MKEYSLNREGLGRRVLIKRLGALVFLTFAGAGVYLFLHSQAFGTLCESFGGKWGAASATCVTRSCFKSGTCGQWAHPVGRCNRLKLNDPIEEVYFQLGEPDRIENNRYSWRATKLGEGVIVAFIQGGKLQELSCTP